MTMPTRFRGDGCTEPLPNAPRWDITYRDDNQDTYPATPKRWMNLPCKLQVGETNEKQARTVWTQTTASMKPVPTTHGKGGVLDATTESLLTGYP